MRWLSLCLAGLILVIAALASPLLGDTKKPLTDAQRAELQKLQKQRSELLAKLDEHQRTGDLAPVLFTFQQGEVPVPMPREQMAKVFAEAVALKVMTGEMSRKDAAQIVLDAIEFTVRAQHADEATRAALRESVRDVEDQMTAIDPSAAGATAGPAADDNKFDFDVYDADPDNVVKVKPGAKTLGLMTWLRKNDSDAQVQMDLGDEATAMMLGVPRILKFDASRKGEGPFVAEGPELVKLSENLMKTIASVTASFSGNGAPTTTVTVHKARILFVPESDRLRIMAELDATTNDGKKSERTTTKQHYVAIPRVATGAKP